MPNEINSLHGDGKWAKDQVNGLKGMEGSEGEGPLPERVAARTHSAVRAAKGKWLTEGENRKGNKMVQMA